MATASGAIPPGAPTRDGAATAAIAAWRAEPWASRVGVLVGLAAAVASTAAWLGTARTSVVAAVALALVPLTIAALVDVVEHRLPNGLVLLAGVPVIAVAAVAAGTGRAAVFGAVLGAGLCGGPMLLTHLVSPAGLGFGDVKAATVLGGALGLLAPVVAVAALLAALALTAVVAVATGRRHVALGPGLVAGSVVALTVARVLGVPPW